MIPSPRAGLKRLLEDIEDGLVDVVVVYKIDRLSRSLADFAKLVEVFDRNGVTFVSVTQSFNTTTSMGRLTLNILLSFAQFEREVTAERIRDKVAASRKKGMWMGGVPPYGYRVENRKLVVDDENAAHVRWIFARFLEIGSCTELAREVGTRGIRTPRGNRIDKKYIYRMLGNRAYIGEAVHKGDSYPGEHDAVIDRALWDKVHANGMAFKPTDWVSSGTRIVRIQNLNKPDAPFNHCRPEMARERSLIDDGSFLISWSGTPGTSFGAFIWDRGPAVLNQHIFRCDFKTSLFNAQFLKLAVNGRLDEMIAKAHGGVGLQHITKGKLEAMLLPLPPLAEQRRIVAKVEELMALLNRLEAARAARETTRDRLTAASLARLTAPDSDAAEFPANARFALATLPALTTRPDQIKPVRQTILNLAVRGKLVEQDPTDEPASELLKRMMKERKETVARRKIRGATPPKAPSADTEGFTLPVSWELCALGQITLITDPNPSHRYPDYSGGTVTILSTREFAGDDGWNPETAKLTTQAFWEFQKETCDFAEGDIIFARKGRLGLPRFLPSFEKFTFSHTLFSIKPMTGLAPTYLLWLLRRDEVVEWLTNEMNQNTGVPTLGKAKTERLPIPLPPLAEQHRIVAEVDALMALCDRLEAALRAADTTRARLLESILHEALAPADRELKAAE